MTKRKAIVCDIDNCVLNSQFILDEIHELGLKGEKKWDYFYEHCNSDAVKIMTDMRNFLKAFRYGFSFIFSTARNEKCVEETFKKLKELRLFKYGVHSLYMRKDGDFRPACEVKKDHLAEIMKEFDIVAFIDDDLQNCKMAKSLGILALRMV